MHHTRLSCLAALAAAAALVVPSVAAANEVTTWNEIGVTTVNAQPPPTSAAQAGTVFVAMVHGPSTAPSTRSIDTVGRTS
jgi:hypothetical protein